MGRNRLNWVLVSRLVMFAFFQICLAVLLGSWETSVRYWILTATLTNIVSIILLVNLCRSESITYFSLFRFNKEQWRKDLLISLGVMLLSVPLILLPEALMGKMFFGDGAYYSNVLFQPIPEYLVYVLLIAFPVTISFAELPTYFGYIMPRISNKSKWISVLIPVIFLSIQHCTLPLVFDPKFILFRAIVFLPFAVLLGITLHKRPSLLLYLVVFHGLIDTMTVVMLLMQ